MKTIFERLKAIAEQFNKRADRALEPGYRGRPIRLRYISVFRSPVPDQNGDELPEECWDCAVDFHLWRYAKGEEFISAFCERVEKMGLRLVHNGDGDEDGCRIEFYLVKI